MDLKLTIEADLTDAKNNLELIKKELADLKQSLANNDKAIAGVNKQLAGLNTNTKEGAKAAAALKNQLSALSTTNNTLVQGISQVTNELAAESENVKKLGKDLKSAEAGSNGMSKGLTKAYSGLRTLANIIPGIGIGGLVGLIAGPLVDALEDLFTSSKKAGESLSETFNESAASVGGNVARLQALVSIAQDVTKSDHDRKEALGALNKEYDSFNGKLTLANINTKFATDLIGKQTDALIRQAQIKGVEDLITEETKKQAEVRNKALADNLSGADKLKNALFNIISPTLGQGDAIISGLKDRDKAIKASQENVSTYKDSLKKLLGEDAAAGTLFTEPKPAAVKKIKEKIQKTLKFSQEDLSKLFFDESTVKLQVPAFVEIDFKKSLRDDPFKGEGLNGILGPEALKEAQAKAELAGLGITKGIQDGLAVGVEGLRFPELIALAESAKKRSDDFREFASGLFADVAVDAFSQLGASIGEALAGATDPIGSFFGGIAELLAKSLKDLGKYIITTSTVIASLKKSLNAAFAGNPTLGIIAGVALIAIGSALEKAIPKFASGVTNFGGGLALVGERGPELVRLPRGSDVIPNHLIGGVGAAEPIVFIANSITRGADIVTVFHRQTGRNSRNG